MLLHVITQTQRQNPCHHRIRPNQAETSGKLGAKPQHQWPSLPGWVAAPASPNRGGAQTVTAQGFRRSPLTSSNKTDNGGQSWFP